MRFAAYARRRHAVILAAVASIVSVAGGLGAGRAPAAPAAPTVAGRGPATVEAPVVATGQILDAQEGFVFFTTGDGFRIDKNAAVLDYHTKVPTTQKIRPRMYARATFDGATGHIEVLELSAKAVPPEGDLNSVRRFAVVASPVQPNPDLAGTPPPTGKPANGRVASREPLTGQPVLVTFTVQVPPNTPFTDVVYISTDLSGWNPQAIRMDRIDALHYRVVRKLSSGTIFYYRYTRGSQATAERGENGLEGVARHVEILNLDVKDKDDIVYHWGDEGLNGQSNPLAVPTPYNPNPFGNLPQNPHRPQPTPPH